MLFMYCSCWAPLSLDCPPLLPSPLAIFSQRQVLAGTNRVVPMFCFHVSLQHMQTTDELVLQTYASPSWGIIKARKFLAQTKLQTSVNYFSRDLGIKHQERLPFTCLASCSWKLSRPTIPLTLKRLLQFKQFASFKLVGAYCISGDVTITQDLFDSSEVKTSFNRWDEF